MRILSVDELKKVSGAQHSIVNIDTTRAGVKVVPLENGTVNIDVTVFGHTTTWNSGVALTCKTFGIGTGLMSLAFTGGNGAAAGFVAFASDIGCTAAVKYSGSMPPSPTDDGDSE